MVTARDVQTTAGAARMLGISRPGVRLAILRGRLRAVKYGERCILISVAEIRRYQMERRKAGRPRNA